MTYQHLIHINLSGEQILSSMSARILPVMHKNYFSPQHIFKINLIPSDRLIENPCLHDSVTLVQSPPPVIPKNTLLYSRVVLPLAQPKVGWSTVYPPQKGTQLWGLWTVLPGADSTLTVRLFQQVTVRQPLYVNQPNKFCFKGHILCR